MTLLHRPAPADPGRATRGHGSARAVGRMGRMGPVVAVSVAALAAGSVLYAVDPNQPGHYPTCPFLALTGLYCPGCGSLRAVHDLLHGDLSGALARNPLAVLAVPYLVLAFVTWVLRRTGRRAPRSTQLPAWTIWALLALVVAFGVLRNLPGFAFLSPA